MNCNRTSCPGKFKCHHSSICVTSQSICDEINDCPNQDDEFFCNSFPNSCPINCSCLLFSLGCRDFTMLHTPTTVLQYIFVIFEYSKLSNIFSFLRHSAQIMFLHTRNNLLRNLDPILNSVQVKHLVQKADVSHNVIRSLHSPALKLFNILYIFNISYNKLQHITPFVFLESYQMHVLDFSVNFISVLDKYALTGLTKLRCFILTGNFITTVSPSVFYSSSIAMILTESYKVCCAKLSMTVCNEKPIWPNSCGKLINDIPAKLMFWIVGLFGFLFNLAAIIMLEVLIRYQRGTSRNYKNIVTSICFGDGLQCVALLVISIADRVLKDSFLEYDVYWRGSIFCYSVAAMFIMSNIISVTMLHFMAISRFHVINDPYHSKYLSIRFVRKRIIALLLFIVLITSVLLFSYRFTSATGLLPNGLCLLIGHVDKSVIPVTINILTILTQMTSVCSLPIIYLKLHFTLRKHKEDIAIMNSSTTKKSGVNKAMFVSLTNIIGWLPSGILLLLTMMWKEYPFVILIWVTTLVLPVNALLNPWIFVFSNILKRISC